jgi:ABC-2 type transport system permease protein
MAVIIPPGWSAKIKADLASPMQILIDGTDPNFASITRGYITAFVGGFNQNLLLDFLNREGREKIRMPVEGRIRVWFNEDLESRNFIVPGIVAVIIMIVGAMLTSLVIAREYENGTMETLLSLPVRAEEFLTGKAIPYFLIAFTDVLIAVLMGQILFGVVMKSSFWLMILAATLYLAVALSLGLLISIVTKSQLAANQIAILVTYLPSLLLSDFVFPKANMPFILQQVTYLIPATYFIDIQNGLYLRDLGLDYLWPSYLVLAAMFIILALLTLLRLKKEGM